MYCRNAKEKSDGRVFLESAIYRLGPALCCLDRFVSFDADTVEDRATFMQPRQSPIGIPDVLVNGRIAVRNGKYTGMVAGQVLRHNRP